jgi:hypothetical protein
MFIRTLRGFCVRAALFLLPVIAPSMLAAATQATFDPRQFSTGDFHGCPPDGSGAIRDPYLCMLKNRDKASIGGKLYTVAQLYRITPRLPNKKVNRDKWTAAQRDLAARWESRSVMVEGYLIDAVTEGHEACNCGSDTYVDHHLWLAASPAAPKSKALVVEVSPRAWPTHPSWSDNNTFKKAVHDKNKVRIAGWLTWDQEHQPHVGHSRMSLWEIHPIHEIQVLRGGQWVGI